MKQSLKESCFIKNKSLINLLSVISTDDKNEKLGSLSIIDMTRVIFKVDWPLNLIWNNVTFNVLNNIFQLVLRIKLVKKFLSVQSEFKEVAARVNEASRKNIYDHPESKAMQQVLSLIHI